MNIVFWIFQIKYVLSLAVGGYSYYLITEHDAFMGVFPLAISVLSVWLQSNDYAIRNHTKGWIAFANICSILSIFAMYDVNVARFFLLVALFLLFCALESRPLSPAERQARAAERTATAMEKSVIEQRKANELASTMGSSSPALNTNAYGVIPDPPPGGCKHLLINAKLKDGTFAQYQTTGLEHQVRSMVDNDPRFEWADVGLLSRDDYGRYPRY